MEQLLLALNEEGENVLDQILKSKNANAKLLKALLGSNANRTNLSKLIAYTLLNMNEQYVAIVLESLRVASYAEPSKDANKAISDISSLANHLSHIEHSNGALKEQYSRLIATLLTVPNVCHYDVANLIAIIWAKPNRRLFYPLLSAIISYHQNEFKTLL